MYSRTRRFDQIRLPLAWVLFLTLASCGVERSTRSEGEDTDRLRLEPLPDEQAELIALWLSDEVEAPLELYERVSADLAHIRQIASFPQSIETFEFVSPAEPSRVHFIFHSGGLQQVRSGQSSVWDSLNSIYHPWFYWRSDTTQETADAYFPGRLSSELLGEAYGRVPEIYGIGIDVSKRLAGAWRRVIYPGRGGADTLFYTFHAGTGPDSVDAPPMDTLSCFITTADGIAYPGGYIPYREEAPDWWWDFCPSLEDQVGGYWCEEQPR